MGYSFENQHRLYLLYKTCSVGISRWWKPWRRALSVQSQTLSALIFRETKTRFGEQSLGILWALGEVMSHILFMWGLWAALGRQAHSGMEISIFLVSGMVPFFMFRNIFTKSADCISANRALLVFSQINIFDFVLSRAAVELMIYVSAMTIFIIALFFFEYKVHIYSFVPVFLGLFVLWLLGIGTGLIYLPFRGKFKIIDTVVDVLLRILYFISGAIFPIEAAPSWAYEYLQYNPILHIINYIRSGFVPNYSQLHDIEYAFICTLFSLMIGLILLKKLRKMILND